MPHNDMPHNALSVTALEDSHALIASLATRALSRNLFDDVELETQLTRGFAADLVKYVISCALDPCEEVAIPKKLIAVHSKFGEAFQGELGQCGKRYGDPPWRSSAPSQACLERVSACILARTNAMHSRVVFSMRGEGTALQPRVPVETSFRENDGTPIVSFRGCDAECLWGDPLKRNCDWEPRYVGQCTSGTKVRLGLTDPKRTARIRVCAGIYGCDSYAKDAGPTTVPGSKLPIYGGLLIAPTAANVIDFDCPANGPILGGTTATGYYAVMLAAPTSSTRLPSETDVQRIDSSGAALSATDSDSYPAPEQAVFTYREGSFYGTLFKDRQQQPAPSCGASMLSGNQYVCYSSLWTKGTAMAAHRLCAGASGDPWLSEKGCFVNRPRPCDGPEGSGYCAPHATPLVATQCLGISAATSVATTWQHPYTSYLNHPCDLFATDQDCLAAVDPNLGITARTPPVAPQF
jgi:hypothetical protein